MIADVTVRLARLADAAEIAAMSRDYIERGLPWTWTEDRVARAIVDLETNVAVVGDSGAVTAFGIMFHTADDAHLLLFAVRRSHQRKACNPLASCRTDGPPSCRTARPTRSSSSGEPGRCGAAVTLGGV